MTKDKRKIKTLKISDPHVYDPERPGVYPAPKNLIEQVRKELGREIEEDLSDVIIRLDQIKKEAEQEVGKEEKKLEREEEKPAQTQRSFWDNHPNLTFYSVAAIIYLSPLMFVGPFFLLDNHWNNNLKNKTIKSYHVSGQIENTNYHYSSFGNGKTILTLEEISSTNSFYSTNLFSLIDKDNDGIVDLVQTNKKTFSPKEFTKLRNPNKTFKDWKYKLAEKIKKAEKQWERKYNTSWK